MAHLDDALTAMTSGPLAHSELVKLDSVWRTNFGA
jgi:hypothetical protein